MSSQSGFTFRIGPQLSEGKRAAIRESVAPGAALNGPYLAMNFAAALIAGFGLIENSPAVIIGAMLIAMLYGPIVGIALGLAEANLHLLRRALLAEAVGAIVLGQVYRPHSICRYCRHIARFPVQCLSQRPIRHFRTIYRDPGPRSPLVFGCALFGSACVVRCEDHQSFVQGIQFGIVEIGVRDISQHLRTGVDVVFGIFGTAHIFNTDGRSGCIFRDYLHDADAP